MFTLKRLHKQAIPAALEKVERYRLLNEPKEAESVCLDILEIDPENQRALVSLLLALTDQFDEYLPGTITQARDLISRLTSEYEREYYAGIISERRAKAILRRGTAGSDAAAYDWLIDAMEHFEKAEALHPPGNDDPILRWNTCARIIMLKKLTPKVEERHELPLE